MVDISDLVKRFGSAPAEVTEGTPHIYSGLVEKFGNTDNNVSPISQETPQPQVTYNPDGTPNPPRFVGTNVAGATQEYKDRPYVDTVAEEYNKAKSLVSQGINEVATNRTASGIGNIGMGILQGAMSPISPLSKIATEAIDKTIPGNPQGIDAGTGEKALMLLPIKGSRTYIKAQLPSNIAIERLIDAVGKENLPEVIKRMKANERISPIDVSNSALQVAQKLAVTEGKHQNVLNDFSRGRTGASANEAVKMAFDENLGVPVNALEKINALKEKARTTGRTLINPIVEKSKPADITPVIQNLEEGFGKDPVAAQTLKQLKAGQSISGPGMSPYQQRLFELRQDLRGNWSDKDKMFIDISGEQGLHEKQVALRREAQDLIDSPDATNRRLGQRLMDVRNQYVDAIDASAPGYKEALGKYADDMEIQEAFERGFSLFGKSPKITNRPEFLEEELKTAKPEVVEALKEGGRIAVDSQTRGFKNSARKGEDLVASEFNADKIKALYGEKEAKKLINKLEDERAIANSDTKLYQNSQTAMRLKNDSRVPQQVDPNEFNLKKLLPYAAEGVGLLYTGQPGLGGAGYFAAKGLNKYGLTPSVNAYRSKQNLELTKLLTAKGEQRDLLIKVLEDRLAPPKGTLQVIKHLALPILPP